MKLKRDWVLALSLGAVGLLFRLWNLSKPKGLIFDEVYYAKNANSLLKHGVEIDPSTQSAEFIVHPPVGKWLIAFGIKLFGYNEYGWRFSAAIIGSASIVIAYFTAKKLFNNEFLAISASFLILVDGLHLVHSRTALLDIFLTFFIQLAFLALISKKYLLSGLALGLAIASKWSGLYFLIAFGLAALFEGYKREKHLGKDRPLQETLRLDFLKRIIQFGLIPLVIYVASWAGWFLTKTGWDRQWSNNILKNFWHYHFEILNFHSHLTEKHPYQSNPWSWLLMGRPTSFLYENPKGCGGTCSQEVLALGTPLLWWAASISLLFLIGSWIVKRNRQSSYILLAITAGYLPWFLFQKRTMFTFYAIAFEPFLMLSLVYGLSKYLDAAEDEEALRRRKQLAIGVGIIFFLNFLYFLPLFIGTPISYNSWHDHMWLPSWI